MSLAEQDRHRDDLDEVTELFIAQSVKELVEEANERADELHEQSSESSKATLVAETEQAVADSKQEKAEEKEDAKSAKDWDVPATTSALQLSSTDYSSAAS